MNFVGMDGHIRNSYFHTTDQAGQVLHRGRCGNTLEEFQAFLADFEGESVRVCLENTGNARALHRMLLAAAAQVGVDLTAEVLDARRLRVIAESVSKCDRLDAAVINELSRSNLKLPVCYLPDDEEFALREHLRARSDLVRTRTMLKNRIHSVLHRRGILTPSGMDLFTAAGQTYLKQVKLDDAGRTIVTRYQEVEDQLEESIQASTKSLRELARRPRWLKPAALLQTMPGVGLITALTILAELGDIRRFRSRAAVANYAGLTPVIRNSNEKRYSGGITHRGSSHLRCMLVEAAWVAMSRVPKYEALFNRVAGRGGKQVAIVAVARRMLEDAFVMLVKSQSFRYADGPGDSADPSAGGGQAKASRRGRKAASSVAG